jgi:hypothetical protein
MLFNSSTLAVLEARMLDLVFLAVTIGFFALAWVYARGCEQL